MRQLKDRWVRFSQWGEQQLWQRLNQPQQRACQITLGLLICGATVRFLPYLAPIRVQDLAQNQQAIEFSDRNGLPLGTILTRDQDHTAVVPLNQISPHFLQAIIAAEDQRFYRHGPLDLKALGRSLLEAAQAKAIVSGASTITMQLARMLEPAPRTLVAKAQEIWLSWRLGAGMSKSDILQAYVNRLPMGGNVYGVEAAARVYFGVAAADLNLAQASLLAALPNDPNRLSPYDHWPNLKRRQRYVLNRMVQDGYITAAQRDRTLAEAVSLQPRQQGIIAAPHFLFWLADQLPEHPAFVRTTIDRPLQQFVEAQVQQVLRPLAAHNVHHAAVLVLDNQSGDVLAYVGSPDYFAETKLGRNDGVQALRQPGSTLKPFLYQLALETRLIRPNTVLADVPTHYAIPGAKLYSPIDYSETFQGPVRVRVAIANSLNIPAVRVLEKVGVPVFLQRLHELGFRHLTHPAEYYGLGLTLGSGEVSLWELAHAYRLLARQGAATPIMCGAQTLTCRPETAYTLKPTAYRPDAAATWALMGNMLSDRYARAKAFGVESVLSLPFASAVKTGTSSDFRDTWTVGFSTDYTVAVWVGNFNGEPMRQVSGVVGAAPLWQRVMLYLHQQHEPTPLPPPANLVQRPICALSGLKPTGACPAVVQEYFYPEDLTDYDRHLDTFYQATRDRPDSPPEYRLNLPAEYDEWLAQQRPAIATSQLKILSPREGDYFLVDSTRSKLQFKLSQQPEQPVEWWLNGQKLTTQTDETLFWSLQPGDWTLEIKSNDFRDRVRFQVQIADTPNHRRGFSLSQNPPRSLSD